MIHTHPHLDEAAVDKVDTTHTSCGVTDSLYAGVSGTSPQSTPPTTTAPYSKIISHHRRGTDLCG